MVAISVNNTLQLPQAMSTAKDMWLRLMMRQMDEVKEQTLRVANGWNDKLRLAVDNLAVDNLAVDNIVQLDNLAPLLSDFCGEFADAELKVHMEVYNEVWDALGDGRADDGYRGYIPCAQYDQLTLEQIRPYPYVCLRDSARYILRNPTACVVWLGCLIVLVPGNSFNSG